MRKIILFGLLIMMMALISGCTITGKAITAARTSWTSCYDSDKGINYYTVGTLTATYRVGTSSIGKFYSAVRKDTCSGTLLTENYCSGNTPFSQNYKCPYGCVDGRCLVKATCTPTTCNALGKNCGLVSDGCGNKLNCGNCTNGQVCTSGICSAQVSVCTDSDGGKDYAAKGTMTSTGTIGNKTDYCYFNTEQNAYVLTEYYCSEQATGAIENGVVCPFGCSDGACLPNQGGRCTDTDNGLDYYKIGTLNFNNRENYTDFCNDQGQLNEMYCVLNGTGYTSASYNCPYGCSNGACLPYKTPDVNLCSGLVENMSLVTYGPEAVFRFQNKERMIVEIPYEYSGTLFLGSAIDEQMLLPGETYTGDPEGVTLLYTTMSGVTHVLQIQSLDCGLTNRTTIKDLTYGTVVAKDANLVYGCSNNAEILSLGTLGKIRLTLQTNKITFEKGEGNSTVFSSNSAKLYFSDSSITVTSPDTRTRVLYSLTASNWSIVSAVSCTMPATDTTCFDSDGGEKPSIKGTTTSKNSNGESVTNTDECLYYARNESDLIEYYCDSFGTNRIISKNIICENGCENGACLAQPKNNLITKCQESDNGDYYQKGVTVGYAKGIYYSMEDTCDQSYHPETYLMEYSCWKDNPNYLRRESIVYCPNGCSNGACVQLIKESVKCVFGNNSNILQKCYSTDGAYSCSGYGTCVIDVTGKTGDQITWKSSCGGYAYTKIDGINDYAVFACSLSTNCTDTDGGSNPFVYGIVKGPNGGDGTISSISDSCYLKVSPSQEVVISSCSGVNCTLHEAICWDAPYDGINYPIVATNDTNCPSSCSNGACINQQGFRNAYWQCYDGANSTEGGPTTCKYSSTWSEYALAFCKGHCKTAYNVTKCGVNTFTVNNLCS